MSETEAQKKRNRRSVAQLLGDYRNALDAFEAKVETQRQRLIGRINRLEQRHKLIAIGQETLNGREPNEVKAALDAQLEDIKLRLRAVSKIVKSA